MIYRIIKYFCIHNEIEWQFSTFVQVQQSNNIQDILDYDGTASREQVEWTELNQKILYYFAIYTLGDINFQRSLNNSTYLRRSPTIYWSRSLVAQIIDFRRHTSARCWTFALSNSNMPRTQQKQVLSIKALDDTQSICRTWCFSTTSNNNTRHNWIQQKNIIKHRVWFMVVNFRKRSRAFSSYTCGII